MRIAYHKPADSSSCCDSPLSAIPARLFEEYLELPQTALTCTEASGEVLHLYPSVALASSLHPCHQSLLAIPVQAQKAPPVQERISQAYGPWATNQLHQARQLPVKTRFADMHATKACLVADKEHVRPWLLDTDSSSNASSHIAAGLISDLDPQEAMLWASSTESILCDPEITAINGFWMDVGTAGDLIKQNAGCVQQGDDQEPHKERDDGYMVREEWPKQHQTSVADDVLLPWDL